MVVAHAAHGVVALVVAAGDHRHIADVEGVEERSALPIGGLDANYPVLASRLWAGGPDVAPHAEKQPIRRGAAYLLHGIALGNGFFTFSYVQVLVAAHYALLLHP